MLPITEHTGICAPILEDNVDTDQIIPSREMTRVSKSGLGAGLFAGWRYVYDGAEKIGLNKNFVLNKPEFAGASILLGGRNFGCGSSREHAVWALSDYGIRVIIAEGFGRIFRNNCARNGLLAISLPHETIAVLHQGCTASVKQNQLTVDLVASEIRVAELQPIRFDIDESDRNMLLSGLDYIDYTLQYDPDIRSFVAADQQRRHWAHLYLA